MLVAYASDEHITVQQRLSFKIESSDQGLAESRSRDLRPSRRSSQSERRRLCSCWVLRFTLFACGCPRASSSISCSDNARSAWKASTVTSTGGWLCPSRRLIIASWCWLQTHCVDADVRTLVLMFCRSADVNSVVPLTLRLTVTIVH